MRVITVAQATQIEIQSGLEPATLMEAAGALAADRIARLAKGPFTVLCGPGHNGADGLVIARHLRARGFDVDVFRVGREHSELFRRELALVEVTPGEPTLRGTIVDALFGIGFCGGLDAEHAALITRVNAVAGKRIAIDVPSGLDADLGHGPAVRADVTLTFTRAKPGFFVNDGPAHVGRVIVINLGIARDVVRAHANSHRVFRARNVRLLPRPATANKTSFGHAVVIAGGAGTLGAGLLAADAAFRAGAGYVTWAGFAAPTTEALRIPEVMTGAVDDGRTLAKATAICVGPGLGPGERTAALIRKLKALNVPTVVDADGLTACAAFDLFPLPADWIVTPHAGEAARILGRDAREVERDRFTAARDLHARTGCIVVLKGFRTVVYDGRVFRIVAAGNAALAKAGTGDVLAGLITGLLAQRYSVPDAAAIGAFVHGRIADDWVAQGKDASALRASDVIDRVPRTLKGFR